MPTVLPYQSIRPCVDAHGHRFAVSNPEPDQWGQVLTYCTRCGRFRHQLDLPRQEKTS
jgi:hypothetical protein